MMAREEVINGLETARKLAWNGEHCNIMDADDALTVYNAIIDALAMLKAQEARVLSLEEARDFFVIEYHYSGKIRKVGDELTIDDDCRDYYNHVWRIWDRMPTDEERRATPWMKN